MMTNRNKTVIYTGGTNDLAGRVQEHRDKEGSSFAERYNVTMPAYYESFWRIYDAIAAEKKITAGSRAKKIALIESFNPGWKDLFDLKIATAPGTSQ